MQEEIEHKTVNFAISTTKLSARTVLRAVKAAFRLYQSKTSQGKQSVRTLLRQNRGVSSVEISKTGIRGLERYAKKYGIDYAIRKDNSEVPPRYLVFFKAPDAEAFHSAFKEYSASLLNKDKRPSVLAKLHELVQAVAAIPDKVRNKDQGAWPMKKNFSKLLAQYLPYILLGLAATNFGEAWRLVEGKELGDKIMSMMGTVPVAFANPLPSLHPLDLLVGVCCGAGLRLAVYLRGKNAKKYRHGMEYGSARWSA